MIYKFNQNSTTTFEQIQSAAIYTVHEKLHSGVRWSQLSPLEKALFNEITHHDAYTRGMYCLMGWAFDFSKLFKTYWVKDKYCGIREIKAPCKTFIREMSACPSCILKIIEVN